MIGTIIFRHSLFAVLFAKHVNAAEIFLFVRIHSCFLKAGALIYHLIPKEESL